MVTERALGRDPDDFDPEDDFEAVGGGYRPGAVLERLRLWARFTGPARLASGVGVALVVAAIAWWLLRTPALPTEAGLPSARSSTTVPALDGAGGPSIPSAPTTIASAETAPSEPSVVVHVTGAVSAPGVYRLSSSSRVGDAIVAAGGASADADPDALNLAAPVLDGDRIDVPTVGEIEAPPFTTLGPGQLHSAGTPGAAASPAGPVDINAASGPELDALPGIGPATSSAIVAYRTEHGPFGSVDALEDVPGIGPAKLAALRDLVTV